MRREGDALAWGAAMRTPFLPTLCLALSLPACFASGSSSPAAVQRARTSQSRLLPGLEEAVRVFDTRAGRELGFDALLERLAAADVVFVGETHLDDTTHRVELALLEGVRERRAGKVVLSLEMFERDVQPALDDYLAGRSDEHAFLAAARPWGNYASDYRPLIESARGHGTPVVAANTPAALRRRVSSGGRSALEALTPEERRLFPAEILPAEASYWERVDRATRGHMNFASLPDEKRLFTGQSLWDNSMGDACAGALAAHPGSTVVHVVGGFHVMYRDGTAAQLARRAPGAEVLVVEVLPVPGTFAARPERDAERADYLVYASALARSASDGQYAVATPAELAYTLDVPGSASERVRAPLVVWLSDGDERPADAREFLRAALGEEAALVVVVPPYPELADDLAPGGRWTASGDFRADQARVQHGLERIVEYVTRRFPVSAERVLIAGRGLGATAVLWSAMYTEWLDARFVAVAPRGARALQLEGLPDRAPSTRDLRVWVASSERESLGWIQEDYRAIGTPTELVELAADLPLAQQIEGALRAALELPARVAPQGQPILCVLERELPRARQWAEIYARRLEREGHAARVLAASELRGDEDAARVRRLSLGGAWTPESFAAGRGIPLAEGDFGGTTVLVVPAGAEAAERRAWLELERAKALAERGPFAELRVAVDGGGPSLGTVLFELRRAGARSVLVVPATFCASPEEMQALRGSIDQRAVVADTFDLAWLPGLCAELYRTPADE